MALVARRAAVGALLGLEAAGVAAHALSGVRETAALVVASRGALVVAREARSLARARLVLARAAVLAGALDAGARFPMSRSCVASASTAGSLPVFGGGFGGAAGAAAAAFDAAAAAFSSTVAASAAPWLAARAVLASASASRRAFSAASRSRCRS